jgi:hypothetical protein
MSFVFNGKTYDIPGSYGLLEVIQNAGANIPDFQVGLIVGRSIKGVPYSANLPASQLIRAYDNGTDLIRDYGDDNIYNAYKYMSKHGGGMVFVINAMKNNVSYSATLKDTTPVTAKDALVFTAKPNWAGVCANDAKIVISKTGDIQTLALTPPKNTKIVMETSAIGNNLLYLNSVSGLSTGSEIVITDNNHTGATEYESFKITSIDPVWNDDKKGFKITLDGTLETAADIAHAARVFQSDVDNKEIFTWDTTKYTIHQVADMVNKGSDIFSVTVDDDASKSELAAITESYMQNVSGATKGNTATNKLETTDADYQSICGSFPSWMKDFENVNKVKIRLVYVDSNDTNVHADFKDLAVTMRTAKAPICVIAGAPWNTPIDDEQNDGLIQRAKTIASDDFVLCGGGADNLPANLSFAPSVLGLKMGNAINHNLTRDQLNFSSVEMDWTDSDITKLLKNGVFVYDKYPTGFRVVRGINSYQDQTHVWNSQDRKTYLQMPRDLADAFFRGLLEGLDNDLVGSDQVTRKKVETYCVKTGNNFKASGLINDFKVLAIKRGEAGWLPEVQIEVDDPTDFFGTRIFVISPSLD